METKRQKQAAEVIKRNFGIVLQNEGPYLFNNALVTVTNVKISPDFVLARIYLSIYNVEDKDAVIRTMEENYVRLRHALAERIRKFIRRIPNLEFFIDETLDEMYRLNELFNRMEADNQFGKPTEAEEE